MRTIKIFVASSKELNDEREKLAALANSLNTALMKLDINVIMVEWENLDSSKGKEAKQEEYNKELCTCDMCIVLYAAKFGEFTKIEFDTACRELETERSLKKLYVYFKDVPEVTPDLQEFKDGYRERYGHYYSTFGNSDMLIADFLRQFIIYESEYLRDYKYVDIRESAIFLNGAKLVELNKLPFVGNNQRENDLRERITELQQDLEDYTPDHPRYKEKKEKLDKLKKELSEHEEGLWETALFIAKISNTASADLLHRSIELFNSGDNKGALALLKDEDIDKGINHSLHLIEIGNEGKAGLQAELDKYRFKIRAIENEKDQDWFRKCINLSKKVLDATSKAYGENSLETALAHDYLGQKWLIRNGQESSNEFRTALHILETLDMRISYFYADVLGHLGEFCLKYGYLLLAERKFKHALEIIQHLENGNYQYYVTALRNLGKLYDEMFRNDEAFDYYQQAGEVLKKNNKQQSLLYAEILSEMAWVYIRKMSNNSLEPIPFTEETDYHKAITLLHRSLEVSAVYLEKTPSQYASTLYDIGLSHYRANHFEDAEKAFKRALEFTKQKQLNQDPILKILKYVYDSLGDFDKSRMISYNSRNLQDDKRPSITDYYRAKEAKDDLIARKIAHFYLEKFPRPNSYGILVTSSEDASQMTYYHRLNNEEIEVFRRFLNRPEDELDIGLQEWLEYEGQTELIDNMFNFFSPFQLDTLSDVDLEHPLKFSKFVMRWQKQDGTMTDPEHINVDLTDDEYIDLMADLIKSSNDYSVNMLVFRRPEIAQKIMSHIVGVYLDGIGDFTEPFLCDLYELKDVVKSILNPFEDKLQLFDSTNEDIKEFVIRHQIGIIGEGEEIYSEYKDHDCYHCVLNFEGKSIALTQEGVNDTELNYDDDYFEFDARIALKKFGLEKPDELYPYLKEHYNTRDCLSRIREFLTGS